MSNLQGWISLHRKIQQSAIYPKGKFTKYEAWIDLLLMANHKDGQVVIGNDVFDIKRGQLIRSIRSLANKWKWSPNKVRRCLKMFEDLNQIRTKSVQKATQITICNYESYQDGRNSNGTQTEQQRNTNGTQTEQQRHTNNNDNKENKQNNVNKRPSRNEVIQYFKQNQQSVIQAVKMFEHYEKTAKPRHKYWRDKKGYTIKNWKLKARNVWFEDNPNVSEVDVKVPEKYQKDIETALPYCKDWGISKEVKLWTSPDRDEPFVTLGGLSVWYFRSYATEYSQDLEYYKDKKLLAKQWESKIREGLRETRGDTNKMTEL